MYITGFGKLYPLHAWRSNFCLVFGFLPFLISPRQLYSSISFETKVTSFTLGLLSTSSLLLTILFLPVSTLTFKAKLPELDFLLNECICNTEVWLGIFVKIIFLLAWKMGRNKIKQRKYNPSS